MQRGTRRALSCPHATVVKSMKDRNGVPMTRLLEGHGGLGREGGHLVPATRSRKCGPLMTRRCTENGSTAEHSTLEFREHFQIQH